MSDGWKPLLFGIILLFVFGVAVPAFLSDFAIEANPENEGYLSSFIDFMDGGIPIAGANLLGVPLPDFTIPNLFGKVFPNVNAWMVTQVQGFQLIPPILSIPLIIITLMLIIYGIVKLFPFS